MAQKNFTITTAQFHSRGRKELAEWAYEFSLAVVLELVYCPEDRALIGVGAPCKRKGHLPGYTVSALVVRTRTYRKGLAAERT